MTTHEFVDYVIERANTTVCRGCLFRNEDYPTNCALQGNFRESNVLGPNCMEIVSAMVNARVLMRLGQHEYVTPPTAR